MTRLKYPFYAAFCINSYCNARCRHCSSAAAMGRSDDLNTEQILNIIIQLGELGIFQIGISGGEPLLHPDIEQIIKKCILHGICVGIGSNGLIIDKEYASKLKEWGVNHVQISLDGSNHKTHDSFRGVDGLFDKALNAISLLKKVDMKVNVCMTPTKLNYKELPNVIQICNELNVDAFNLSQFVPVGRGTTEIDLPPEVWKDILELWDYNRRRLSGKMQFITHEAQQILIDSSLYGRRLFNGCQAGNGVCCIKSNGDVIPCVMLDIPIGNLKEKSFSQIWENSSILTNINNRDLYSEPCKTCDYVEKCGGCRGVAYGVTGNYLEKDTHCWLHI